MDLLKKELERKKQNVEKAKLSSGGRRFFRTKDRRRWEDTEEEEEDRLGKRKKSPSDNEEAAMKKSSRLSEAGVSPEMNDKNEKESGRERSDSNFKKSTEDDDAELPAFKMSPEDVTQRLRSLGYPIKLFGESSWERLKRLRKALDEQKNVQAVSSEMDEFRLGKGHGIRNPFLEKEKDSKNEAEVGVEDAGEEKEAKKDEGDDMNEDDPHKRVYKYFKNLLNQWEEDLALRPESVKKSVAGRNETKTLKQCKDYIRPMFKLCKRRNMDESILNQLNKIVSFCLQEEFVKAHDTYIDISIGRAAWPIGVTMVGIHARTGRAKIESSNVAHVMNSELQRKYLTSVKRLMSYAQKKSKADPSKKVMN